MTQEDQKDKQNTLKSLNLSEQDNSSLLLTDLMLRFTAMENVLINKNILPKEEYLLEIKKAVDKLTKSIQQSQETSKNNS